MLSAKQEPKVYENCPKCGSPIDGARFCKCGWKRRGRPPKNQNGETLRPNQTVSDVPSLKIVSIASAGYIKGNRYIGTFADSDMAMKVLKRMYPTEDKHTEPVFILGE